MAGELRVTQEDEDGRNTHFQDKRSGKQMTRAQCVQAIEAGLYPDYHVRKINGVKTPCSNPDGKGGNNLG